MSKYDFTSGTELKDFFDGEIKIMTYADLLAYRTIESALEPYGRIIILYEFAEGIGHWCSISFEGSYIRFFDSYGIKPDDQQRLIAKSFRERHWNDMRYLSNLLKHCPWEIDYNEYPLQSTDPGIGTCGKWCAARLIFNEYTTDQFWELFKTENGVDSDDLIVEWFNKNKK